MKKLSDSSEDIVTDCNCEDMLSLDVLYVSIGIVVQLKILATYLGLNF